MSVLQVKSITKYYGNTVGVRNISFAVEAGEIFGFLGSNGAGKTTTIRLLLNLIYTDSGQIYLFDQLLKRSDAIIRERIGYLPGDFKPYREMTALGFLEYMSGYRSQQPSFRSHLIDQLQFSDHHLHKKIKTLSHGTRQKLGIIFALETEPDLAILDEPTLGLDPLIQGAFYRILIDMQQRGRTIFLSSHILPEIEKICHRVAIIRNGEIVALESVDNLKAKRPRRLILEFDGDVKDNPLQLKELQFLERDNDRFIYLLHGEMMPLLKKISKFAVRDIFIPEPDLEDIFLTYYAGENHD